MSVSCLELLHGGTGEFLLNMALVEKEMEGWVISNSITESMATQQDIIIVRGMSQAKRATKKEKKTVFIQMKYIWFHDVYIFIVK